MTSSTLLADPPSNETIDVFYIKIAKSFRTTSNEALCTLTGNAPIVIKDEKAANIQGVPGGKDLTSGKCSLGQTIPI